MILFSITIPTDLDYLVRLVWGLFTLIKKSHPEVTVEADANFDTGEIGK